MSAGDGGVTVRWANVHETRVSVSFTFVNSCVVLVTLRFGGVRSDFSASMRGNRRRDVFLSLLSLLLFRSFSRSSLYLSLVLLSLASLSFFLSFLFRSSFSRFFTPLSCSSFSRFYFVLLSLTSLLFRSSFSPFSSLLFRSTSRFPNRTERWTRRQVCPLSLAVSDVSSSADLPRDRNPITLPFRSIFLPVSSQTGSNQSRRASPRPLLARRHVVHVRSRPFSPRTSVASGGWVRGHRVGVGTASDSRRVHPGPSRFSFCKFTYFGCVRARRQRQLGSFSPANFGDVRRMGSVPPSRGRSRHRSSRDVCTVPSFVSQVYLFTYFRLSASRARAFRKRFGSGRVESSRSERVCRMENVTTDTTQPSVLSRRPI